MLSSASPNTPIYPILNTTRVISLPPRIEAETSFFKHLKYCVHVKRKRPWCHKSWGRLQVGVPDSPADNSYVSTTSPLVPCLPFFLGLPRSSVHEVCTNSLSMF